MKLGDSVTTDHISPAGAIPTSTVAGRYLAGLGHQPSEFNTYASRRGNHEVMVRGTFANVRLRNELVAPTVGGVTRCFARDGEVLPVYEAARAYQQDATPLVVLAGKEYGSGSSRDWAAKGPALLGVRAVLAQSFERIHRSNLIGMGILPLEFRPGQNAQTLGLSGEEEFDVLGLEPLGRGVRPEHVTVRAGSHTFEMIVRLDTPARSTTTGTAGSCPTCSARCWPGNDGAWQRNTRPGSRPGRRAPAEAEPLRRHHLPPGRAGQRQGRLRPRVRARLAARLLAAGTLPRRG